MLLVAISLLLFAIRYLLDKSKINKDIQNKCLNLNENYFALLEKSKLYKDVSNGESVLNENYFVVLDKFKFLFKKRCLKRKTNIK